MKDLPSDLLTLLRQASPCYLVTLMRDGSPQVTQTWVDTDDRHVLINSVSTHLKVKNIERDARVAVAIGDPENPMRFFQVRGRVVEITAEGARDHIEALSQRYIGAPYPWFGGNRNEVRVILKIEPDSISGMG